MTDRTFTDWATDARTVARTLREASEHQVTLGVELRERWDDWRGVAGHPSKDACLRAELGISAKQLSDRLSYRRRSEHRDSGNAIEANDSTESEPPASVESDQEPRSAVRSEVEEHARASARQRQPSTRYVTDARVECNASNAIKEGATAGEAALSALRAMTVEQRAEEYASVVATARYWWEAIELCEVPSDSLRERVAA